MHHRPPSPRQIDDLPASFHSAGSPSSGTPPVPDNPRRTFGMAAESLYRADHPTLLQTPDFGSTINQPDVDADSVMEGGDSFPSTSAIPYRSHHPQNHNMPSPSQAGFSVKGTPGGDCKRICLRHQRMVDGGAREDLQKVSLKCSMYESWR